MSRSRSARSIARSYADLNVATTHFGIGREKLAGKTDKEVFALWNEHIEARDELMKEYDHVAVDVPPGRPQVRLKPKSSPSAAEPPASTRSASTPNSVMSIASAKPYGRTCSDHGRGGVSDGIVSPPHPGRGPKPMPLA